MVTMPIHRLRHWPTARGSLSDPTNAVGSAEGLVTTHCVRWAILAGTWGTEARPNRFYLGRSQWHFARKRQVWAARTNCRGCFVRQHQPGEGTTVPPPPGLTRQRL